MGEQGKLRLTIIDKEHTDGSWFNFRLTGGYAQRVAHFIAAIMHSDHTVTKGWAGTIETGEMRIEWEFETSDTQRYKADITSKQS